MEKPEHDADDVLRRMLNTKKIASLEPMPISAEDVKNLADKANSGLVLDAANLQATLSQWLNNPSCFKDDSARASAEYLANFLLQK
jgi:hypothetical protein